MGEKRWSSLPLETQQLGLLKPNTSPHIIRGQGTGKQEEAGMAGKGSLKEFSEETTLHGFSHIAKDDISIIRK